MINKVGALLLLILFLPLLLCISIIIFVEDGLPIFFTQKRVGMNSSYFNIYKFRSMKRNTPNVATHLLNNPRSYLLKSGEKMRKLSIDELPNLINILKGEMVFIGPRPALYNQYDLLELRNKYGIDKLKPGITGWAQINGRDEISIEEKVQFEKEYFQKRSLLLDLKIIFWTISKVFKSNEVSH